MPFGSRLESNLKATQREAAAIDIVDVPQNLRQSKITSRRLSTRQPGGVRETARVHLVANLTMHDLSCPTLLDHMGAEDLGASCSETANSCEALRDLLLHGSYLSGFPNDR